MIAQTNSLLKAKEKFDEVLERYCRSGYNFPVRIFAEKQSNEWDEFETLCFLFYQNMFVKYVTKKLNGVDEQATVDDLVRFLFIKDTNIDKFKAIFEFYIANNFSQKYL